MKRYVSLRLPLILLCEIKGSNKHGLRQFKISCEKWKKGLTDNLSFDFTRYILIYHRKNPIHLSPPIFISCDLIQEQNHSHLLMSTFKEAGEVITLPVEREGSHD